jgi:serine/threonine-protein phosphatase 4 regulatory subunit 1
MPVYTRCLAEDDEIRELVFEHVEIFLCNLPLELGWSSFLDLCRAWSEGTLGGWRARERLALHIPALFKCFGEVDGVESVLEMMRDALLDPFAAVRDAATKGIPTSYEVLGQDSEIAKRFRETLLDLGTSSVFRQRLT